MPRERSTLEEYFHRVRTTHFAAKALAAEVAAYTGHRWVIQFTKQFDFRLVDLTDPKSVRDYGWYRTWDEVVDKFGRLYPDVMLGQQALDNNA